MYLIPPMDDEPPPEFVAFVMTRADQLRAEAERLVGGDSVADRLYRDLLTETAGRWRRLTWWSRLSRTAIESPVRESLQKRAAQWREDQVYEVHVTAVLPAEPMRRHRSSLALRKAAVIEQTTRTSLDALADAEIAWVHAWRRSQRRHVMRVVGGAVLLVGGMIQYFDSLSSGGY